MSEYPLIQFNPAMRGGSDMSNVTFRVGTEGEVHEAARLAALAAQLLAPSAKALQKAIDQAPADGLQLLQQELGAQVIAEYPPQQAPGAGAPTVPQGPQHPANAFNPQGHYQVPQAPGASPLVQQFNQALTQPAYNQYQPAPQAPAQPAFAGETATCLLCDASMACPDGGCPTNLIVITARTGKKYNKHGCNIQGHKGRMCKSPAWQSKISAAQAAGQILPADLVVG
jgi:hypothetical protein